MTTQEIYEKFQKKLVRCASEVERNKKRYVGKESEFTFHGGYRQGYYEGKLSALEEIIDYLGLEIRNE